MLESRHDGTENIPGSTTKIRVAEMKRPRILPLVLLTLLVGTLLVGTPASSADLQKGLAAYKKGRYAAALKEWKPLAEKGNATAQHNLGQMYKRGKGVKRNYATAVTWFTRAAEQGYGIAQVDLGLMHVLGKGTLRNNIRAHMWWNIAASRGDRMAGRNRDSVAKKMSKKQLGIARKLAREWLGKHKK